MKEISIKGIRLSNKLLQNIMIIIGVILLLYFIVALYFTKHYFFHTRINGVDVSLKNLSQAEENIQTYVKDYELQLKERNNKTEVISGKELALNYNPVNRMASIFKQQKAILWIRSLFGEEKYYDDHLFVWNKDQLEGKIKSLSCLNRDIIEPQNASFQYIKGSYHIVAEVYGNRVILDRLSEVIHQSIKHGNKILDLDKSNCYLDPVYTSKSEKTRKTNLILNQYVATKLTYLFGDKKELLDGNVINQWLTVDNDMEVVINQAGVRKFIKEMSKKYDTIGIARNFKASTGKLVEVKGGIYGWKINQEEETKALIESIKTGKIVEKEPIYAQKAISRDENDIGNTYIEVNISRQYLWFYKDGKLVAQGAVVTGNPNNGNATVLGTYMVNYKQKDAVLKGPNYEAKVTYWMPFYGNIGLHDAKWRSSFGGQIYKRRGTHGCVNAPYYLAKTIFQYIESGIPIICYEE